jgi:uncharacterized integral membrane protein
MADQYTTDPPAPAKSSSRVPDTATLVLLAVVILFAITNSRSTKITWVVASSRAPLFIVIGICVAIGFGAGYYTAQRRAKS